MPRFSYDLPTIIDAISNFEKQIEELRAAKEKMLPELAALEKAWTTEGAKVTTISIGKFLNEDFENFVAMFDDARDRLNFAKHTFKQIENME